MQNAEVDVDLKKSGNNKNGIQSFGEKMRSQSQSEIQ